MSLIRLTAQWIDDDFTLHHVMLHAKQFRGSHTGRAIANVFEEMLATWAIPKSSVHVVVRDNARNLVKGMERSIVCGTYAAAGHQRGSSITALRYGGCGSRRQIVSHSKHSNLAYARLQDIQIQLGQPMKRLQLDLQQEVWNSTFYMGQTLFKQKRVIGVCVSPCYVNCKPVESGEDGKCPGSLCRNDSSSAFFRCFSFRCNSCCYCAKETVAETNRLKQ